MAAIAAQLLAYCSSLRLPVGHLVYPKGFDPVRDYWLPHTGLHGDGVGVLAHALDLSLSPDELLDRVADIAGRMTTAPTTR